MGRDLVRKHEQHVYGIYARCQLPVSRMHLLVAMLLSYA